MCEELAKEYGFLPVQEEHLYECQNNSLILPKYGRYLGMGHVEILAEVKDYSNNYFLFEIYGANGWEHQINREKLEKFTINDSLSFEQLNNKLKGERWCTIEKEENFKNCSKITVKEHYPNGNKNSL